MPFPPSVQTEALVRSRRCCCVCHKFAGVHTNVHHIIQEADGGPNTLDNAVVLCLNCHADVGHYNDHHPLGNKYSPKEVTRHRDLWWEWCKANPYAPLPHDPIKVSPSSVRVRPDGWEPRTPIVITNTAPCVLYNVWVKFALGGTGLRGGQLSTSHPCNSTIKLPFAGAGKDTKIFADSFIVTGLDPEGYEGYFLVMHRINPGANVEIVLTVKNVSRRQGGYIKVGVLHHCTEAAVGPATNAKGEVAMRFHFPNVDGTGRGPVPQVRTVRVGFDGDCPVHGKDCPDQ